MRTYASQKIFTGAERGERSELFITKGEHRCFASVNANVSRNFLRVSYIIIIISILHHLFLSLSATHSEFARRNSRRRELSNSREEERQDREEVV